MRNFPHFNVESSANPFALDSVYENLKIESCLRVGTKWLNLKRALVLRASNPIKAFSCNLRFVHKRHEDFLKITENHSVIRFPRGNIRAYKINSIENFYRFGGRRNACRFPELLPFFIRKNHPRSQFTAHRRHHGPKGSPRVRQCPHPGAAQPAQALAKCSDQRACATAPAAAGKS